MASRFHRWLTNACLAIVVLAAPAAGPALAGDVSYSLLGFNDLEGWEHDDHDTALRVFRETCKDIDKPEWRAICAAAHDQNSGKAFFELFFRPVQIDDGNPPLFTGYFEPELNGARHRSQRYRYPVYRFPSEAANKPWLTRRQILESGVLEGRGLEIAWVDDAVELFFLQVQGSGRIRLDDGGMIRVGYGGANGHPYVSVGRTLVERGTYNIHQVSAEVIKNWVRRNPIEGRELLFANPSYVFFRVVNQVPADRGPLGAMNRSVTEGRSIAVDPDFVPLGAPVWIEKAGRHPMRRLMVAQDTGSAIKGAQRADIFLGTGDRAGRAAGRLKDPGRMLVLMPIQQAFALDPDGGL